jgi:dihydrofolate synthase/folylpolyglutamate synthase
MQQGDYQLTNKIKCHDDFRSFEEALYFLYKSIDYEKLICYQYNAATFNLDRMLKMLEYVGSPHKDIPCIHITGTKGKGSTAIMLATILENSGLKTGLFTSPHLVDLEERIQINRQNIPRGAFIGALNALKSYIQSLRDTDLSASPTFFEILTSVCMLYFKRKLVDMAVFEVGLGGRLDSTNVVLPQASVITNVGLEHTAILGNTLADIAYEKAGIIKQNVPVVSAVEDIDSLSIIENICKEKHARLYLLGRDILVESVKNSNKNDTRGLLCKIKTWRHTYDNIFLPLIGTHQAKNCALALGALEIMRESGCISIDDATIRHALSTLRCPARVEIINKNPTIIIDCAHTVDSMRFLRNAIIENFKYDNLILVLGFSQDKDLENILKEIVVGGNAIILTKSKSPRAAEPEDLNQKTERLFNKRSKVTHNVTDAVFYAKQIATRDDLICITGSSYVAGEALQTLKTRNAQLLQRPL